MILVLDNEVREDYRYLAPEITRLVPDAEYRVFVDDPSIPTLDNYEGIILSGSTASVYEDDNQEWITDQKELIHRCIDERIPLLGVCFGHQIINYALGGTVEQDHRRSTLVEMIDHDRNDAVLQGVNSVVPVLHADLVRRLGEGMISTAKTRYDDNFCSRHETSPVWTVQFHPEYTEHLTENTSDWTAEDNSFSDSNSTRVLDNFATICRE